MAGLLRAVLEAPAGRVLFESAGAPVTAGLVRAAAARALPQIAPGAEPLALHADAAGLFVAGLLAAVGRGRPVALLPHRQPGYLAELGFGPADLLTDGGEAPALAYGPAGEDAPLALDPDRALPLVFYTSGSTGAPKAVAKPLAALEIEAGMWSRRLGPAIARIAGTVSHQHIYGMIFRIVLPALSGRIGPDRAAFAWPEIAASLAADVALITSPAHLTRLPPELALPHGPPALVTSSGQALPLAAARAAAALLGAPPLEILGSTETGGVATRQRRDDAEPWTPLAGVGLGQAADGTLLVTSAYTGEPRPVAMGDRVELLADGRFRLLARADRVAKIEGKRISLPRVEAGLAALPEIEAAAALALGEPARLAAAVVLTPAGRALLVEQGAFRLSRSLRARLAPAYEPAERPKRWRFVEALPVNSQGKQVQAALAALFAAETLQDELDCRLLAVDDATARIGFTLQPELRWFRGHFPDRPILPGVAQVHIAAGLADELWGFRPGGASIRQMKFRHILTPGDQVELALARDAGRDRLRFAFHLGRIVASEGVLGG
jgi:hypothetical protein